MKASNIFVLMTVFALGWFLHSAFASLNAEKPMDITGNIINSNLERASPSDSIPESNIHVYNDKIVIDVDDPEWATFTDTNSMDPVFDKGSNALQIVPKNESQIQVGDIISFTTRYDSGVIIHRVIKIGYDEEGWYAITKGDNNPFNDPGKTRFKDIKKLLIGIIY
jgi:hypothetical protein